MVGIVLVSHSARLAEGLRELIEQMVQGQVPVAAAGGIDDPENPIGTDAFKVQAAIESVYSPDGVVVLMDLGSAFLSAETALEFLAPEQQEHVFLSPAPFIEGALSAAVQASTGGSVEQVLREARAAGAAKEAQFGPADEEQPAEPEPALPGQTEELRLTVQNKLGLHARPAARFVKTASRFQAQIRVGKSGKTADAKSINQVATLGVRQGDAIVVSAAGSDAAEALKAIQALAEENFGDPPETAAPQETAPPRAAEQQPIQAGGGLAGVPASPGIAIGPAYQYRATLPEVVAHTIDDPEAEWARLQSAIAATKEDLEQLQAKASQRVGPQEAAIFEAHELILGDPDLQESAKNRIFTDRLNSEAAWQEAIEGVVADYRSLEDEYQRGRAADVQDVGQRVLSHLLGVLRPRLELDQPSILLAKDLTPSDTAQLDPAEVLGICTELGGATSHSAILARALGIPAVVGLNVPLGEAPNGRTIALDGSTGQVWLQPDPARLEELTARRAEWLREREASKAAAHQPAVTRDGAAIEVAANIGGPHDAEVALSFGAEGVGLFRTEFLFMERESAPTEEEQLSAYQRAAEAMGQRPLVIRTLDVGGDKPLPYIDLGEEANPFLGQRGIRFCLNHPELFKTQLRAILRASPGHNLKLMFPMIGTLAELRAAKALLAGVRDELQAAGEPFDPEMEVGIMIEVPSAAAVADLLAPEADFFSVGSNDLTQYVMAADRGNSQVAGLADALQPAVLRLIRQAVEAAHAAGIWAGLCGELAGNAQAAPLLVGLGLDELSMSAPNIPPVKAAIRAIMMEEAKRLAEKALALESADEVRELLSS